MGSLRPRETLRDGHQGWHLTEWQKDDIPSNADLGEFPWWSIYITADQVVEVAVDDVFVKSESLPYPVEARGKLASRWGEIKLGD